MPHHARAVHYNYLKAVATKAEVARLWRVDKKTVDYAIDASNIAALQCGRIWLVSLPSVVEFWGQPRASKRPP